MGIFRQIGSEQLVVVRVGRGGGAGTHAELGKDVTHVPVNRALADEQLGCDGLVRLGSAIVSRHAGPSSPILPIRESRGTIIVGASLLVDHFARE